MSRGQSSGAKCASDNEHALNTNYMTKRKRIDTEVKKRNRS